ncbi:MAG: hypothetical protein KDK39_07130 [Leptospiraceae bacterium]|nr:hypothetical protein [Leptospiraceae bacterium]
MHNTNPGKHSRTIVAIMAAGLLCLMQTMEASPRFGQQNAADQIEISQNMIDLYKGRLRLLPVDLFEKEHVWYSRGANSLLDQRRFLTKTPFNTGKAWDSEKALLKALGSSGTAFRYSLSVQTAFETPGRDSYQLLLRNPQPLRGQLMRMSVWVHSNDYRHVLYALFRNASGQVVKHRLGRLQWHGWRRIESDLPVSLYSRGSRIEQRYTHFFNGFLLQSDRNEHPGQINLLFDNLLVLSDMQELQYPGAEVQDAWP